MNFLKNTILLIVSPTESWRNLKHFSIPTQAILTHLFYPLLVVLASSAFVQLFIERDMTLESAIINAILDVVKYFFTFYITEYLVTGFYSFTNKDKDSANKFNIFLAYNLAILIILNILRNILPGFPFLEIIPLYICYVIYEGCIFLNVSKQSSYKFVITVSFLVLLLPLGIKYILNLLIPDFTA